MSQAFFTSSLGDQGPFTLRIFSGEMICFQGLVPLSEFKWFLSEVLLYLWCKATYILIKGEPRGEEEGVRGEEKKRTFLHWEGSQIRPLILPSRLRT